MSSRQGYSALSEEHYVDVEAPAGAEGGSQGKEKGRKNDKEEEKEKKRKRYACLTVKLRTQLLSCL